MTAPSARYKSDHSSEVVPSVAPSEASGFNEVVTAHDPVSVPPPETVSRCLVLS